MIKKFLKKIIYGHRCDGETYIKFLRSIGCRIGKETKVYAPRNVLIDETRPWLIDIGDNVQITDGVRILTHGYDWSVLKVKYGNVLGSSGKVKIGNNVFIGVNTTVLKGVTIGNNVIIGANSLVNKDCVKEGVYGGDPVRYIMPLEEYFNKREERQLDEATECAIEYYNVYKTWPEKEIFREFFWLFENKKEKLCDTFDEVMKLEGNSEKSYKVFERNKKMFENYDEFMEFVRKEKNDKKNIK